MVSKVLVERSLDDNFNSLSEKVLQVDDQASREPGTGGRTDLDEKIDIAVRPGLSTGDRAEHADGQDTVLGGDAANLFALFMNQVQRRHFRQARHE